MLLLQFLRFFEAKLDVQQRTVCVRPTLIQCVSLVKCKEDPSISVSGIRQRGSRSKPNQGRRRCQPYIHTYKHTAVSFVINYEVSHYAYFNVDMFVTKYSYSTTYT